MNIQIPGYKTLDLSFLVLDYNGTIAVDGQIPPEVKEALVRLSKDLQIHVLTADTHGHRQGHVPGTSSDHPDLSSRLCHGFQAGHRPLPGAGALRFHRQWPQRLPYVQRKRSFHLRHRSRRRLFKALKLYGPVYHIHSGCPGPSGKTKAAGGRPAGLGPRLAPARKPPKAFSATKKCI